MADPAFDLAMPLRRHDFEQHPDGLVTVLVPKFSSRLARRFVLPLLAKPVIRVHLDEMGSLVWLACDGQTTVARLTELVQQRLGVAPPAAQQRVHTFLHQLTREGSLAFQAPADEAGSP
jgi:hypothetical protein